MYFGNSNCVLEYDGANWRRIYVPNYSTVRALAIDSASTIFAGAYNELGVLLPDAKGSLEYSSLVQLIDSSYRSFGDIWNIHCLNNQVYFLSDKYIFRYKDKKFNYWEKTQERFYLSFHANNELFIQEIGRGLLKVKGDSLVSIKNGDFFSNIRIHAILPYKKNQLLICTRNKGLFLYDNTNSTATITSVSEISVHAKNLNTYLKNNVLYHGTKISDNLFALSTITGSVLLVDSSWKVVDIINHESTGIVSSAHYLYYEKDKALWMALANGISRVEIFSPFRYWNDDNGINGTISDVASMDDYLYITTGSGVYYMQRKADNVNFSVNNFKKVEGQFEQAWGFLYFILPTTDYNKMEKLVYSGDVEFLPTSNHLILLVATSTGLFEISGGKSVKISDYRGIFDIYQYKQKPSNIFLALSNGIAHISYKDGKWINHGMQFNITDKIRELNEDSLGNLWASAAYKGVYKITNPLNEKEDSIKLYDTDNGLPSVQSVHLANYNKKLLFISLNEAFTLINEADTFQTFEFPEQKDTSIWLADSLSWYQVRDNIVSNFYVTTYTDTAQWFATTDGTFRYVPTGKKNYLDTNPALVRKVLSGDSIIFDGTNYTEIKNAKDTLFNRLIKPESKIELGNVLNFKDNSLTFHYSLPFFENEEKTEFSFFLEGNDKEWSPWSTETKKEYTNLREGDYSFKVKARNMYMLESPVAEFKFTVLAPWYRTFAAILGYILLGIIVIIGIVRLYTYRLIKEKDKLEKIVIERTQEILMQKEEILVQAEHLKDANERISAKNEELEKQKWEITNQALKLKKANVELIKLSKVASETDNAIAIFDNEGNMEWVNEGFTRLYGYTYEEYAKERNINLLEGSDNPNITEAVKSCLENKKSVVYEYKTTNKKGKEIWAQTTLTHVIEKNGETINLVAIDSDITKLKQAEKEIEEQRDKLAISNATKNKFFRIIAHDLRNPMSTLAGSTNIIFNDFEEYDKEQTKAFIGELNRLSQTTFNLLENLLDWSTSQMGEIKFSPKHLNIKSLTEENLELIDRKVDTKNIELKTNLKDHCAAFADEDMVKTIIRNLLSNAVKFTPENGTIEITCGAINDDYLKYSVKDTGIGINQEDQKKLFRIDAHHTTPGLSNEKGSGLGLILCKEFIEKNGGEIKIISDPQKGTTIEFTLKRKAF